MLDRNLRHDSFRVRIALKGTPIVINSRERGDPFDFEKLDYASHNIKRKFITFVNWECYTILELLEFISLRFKLIYILMPDRRFSGFTMGLRDTVGEIIIRQWFTCIAFPRICSDIVCEKLKVYNTPTKLRSRELVSKRDDIKMWGAAYCIQCVQRRFTHSITP